MSRWVGTDDLQSSLPTSTVLRFCDHFTVSDGRESAGGTVEMLTESSQAYDSGHSTMFSHRMVILV